MQHRTYYIYILANKRNGTLYIGVTNDLIKRIWEHKHSVVKGFTNKYEVKKLVYYQSCKNIESAIMRDKQLKRWKRSWKIREIEKINPNWNDLYFELL
jgi:putative endonuclease